MASGFLVLISFFTRIPIGKRVEYNEDNFKSALSIYCLTGAIIGLILVVSAFIGQISQDSYIKGLFITITYIIVTGGIHLDGASDSVDGLFSGRTGDRIFEIMSDSHVGAFGVICLIVLILSQFVLFSQADLWICFMMPVVGRCAVVVGSFNKKYAKNKPGMGSVFIEAINKSVFLSNILILIIICVILPNRNIAFLASFITLIFAYYVSVWIEKKIGGMTGDTCGFLTEITQVVFMFVALIVKGMII